MTKQKSYVETLKSSNIHKLWKSIQYNLKSNIDGTPCAVKVACTV